ELREMYGFSMGPAAHTTVAATLAATRLLRPLLPPRYRYIAPYQDWRRAGPRGGGNQATKKASATAE
ncbi:MAG TPA: hypothetical protein VK977_01730, partial [Actinomycetota bacterium]|nr:hypothetical protein [Actinomycetota bacterium]